MDVRSALVAHPQSAELPEPGQRPLNDPPVRAQPATMPCAPAGYHRRDVAQTQGLPVRPRVIRSAYSRSGLRRGRPHLPLTACTALWSLAIYSRR